MLTKVFAGLAIVAALAASGFAFTSTGRTCCTTAASCCPCCDGLPCSCAVGTTCGPACCAK